MRSRILIASLLLAAALFALPGFALAEEAAAAAEPASGGETVLAQEDAADEADGQLEDAAPGDPGQVGTAPQDESEPAPEPELEPLALSAVARITAADNAAGSFTVRIEPASTRSAPIVDAYLLATCGPVGPVHVGASVFADGSWSASVSGADLSFAQGIWVIEAHVVGSDGADAVVSTFVEQVARPAVEVSAQLADDQSSCSLGASNVEANVGEVGAVRFQVWSDGEGMDDVRWYDAVRDPQSGEWTVADCLAALRRVGVVHAACHATVEGRSICIGSTSFAIDAPRLVVELEFDEAACELWASGLDVKSGQRVEAVVWSAKGGADDAARYRLAQLEDGTWFLGDCTAGLRDAGAALVELQVVSDSSSVKVASSGFCVTAPTGAAAFVNPQPKSNRFTVRLSSIQAPNDVSGVRVLVRLGSDSSLAHWYTAVRNADGSWSATVTLSNHGMKDTSVTGATFSCEAYVVSPSGMTLLAGKSSGYSFSSKNESTLRSRIVAAARSFIGLNEDDGSYRRIIDLYNTIDPLPVGYQLRYNDSWCAAFVSVVSKAAGTGEYLPYECGCQRMINLFMQLGAWVENDAYTPSPGDVIFYDWKDSGAGDCTGVSHHVGVVESVSGGVINVIEGNYSDCVKRRSVAVNSRYIRGFGILKA